MGIDDRTREDLKQWLRDSRVYLWTFVAGGIFALACTYYPLHSGKTRQVHELEDRLLQESKRFTEMQGEFETIQAQADGQPDRDTFEALQGELAGAETRKNEFEDQLERANRKVKELEKARNSWKSKYATLEKSRGDLAEALVAAKTSLKSAQELAKNATRAPAPSPTPTDEFAIVPLGEASGSNVGNTHPTHPLDDRRAAESIRQGDNHARPVPANAALDGDTVGPGVR